MDTFKYHRVKVTGRYRNDLASFIGPKTLEAGVGGADMIVPFILTDG